MFGHALTILPPLELNSRARHHLWYKSCGMETEMDRGGCSVEHPSILNCGRLPGKQIEVNRMLLSLQGKLQRFEFSTDFHYSIQ